MIELFKAGTSDVVNGVTCQRALVSEFGFEHYLNEGWHLSEKDVYPEKPEKLVKRVKENDN